MEATGIIQQLAQNAETIRCLVAGIDHEQAHWKPTPGDWSMVEVINHLYDEEREDFRLRLDTVLHRPGEHPPGIDPEGWVIERNYNARALAESTQRWVDERRHSIRWLAGLVDPDWELAYTRPDGFRRRAGDLLAAWLAHDFLHLRQLVELHYGWVKRQSAPYDVGYAGDW
jgi:hypothetical protein